MKTINLVFAFVLLFVMASCSDKEEIKPVVDHYMVARGVTASGKTVKLWSDQNLLTVAYNRLYISVQNSDSSFTGEQAVSLLPLMDMMTMKHSSPVEQPVFNTSTKLYEAGVVFSMPSGDMGSWKVAVKIGQEEVALDVNIKAAPLNTKYTNTFVGSDGVSYTISLVEPKSPKIGINDLVIMVNQRETMMSFPLVADLRIEVTPEMPSMGHGSPNNSNPVYTGSGRYAGKVNFTMTGDWRLHFKIYKGTTVITEDVALDLLF